MPTGKGPGRRPSVLLVVAAAVVTALAVAAVAFATSGSDPATRPAAAPSLTSPRSTSTTATSPVVAAAAIRWLVGNVAKDAPILASATVVRELQAVGFTGATDASAAPVSWLVLDAQVRAAGSGFDVVGTVDQSVPVATFGTVQVASVLRSSPAAIKTLLANAAAERGQTGGELASNPDVHAQAVDLAAMRAGRLDLRAATLLALVAADTPVTLVELPQDPAERLAGRAIRTMTITAEPAVVTGVLRSLPPRYAPARVDTTSSTTTIVWPAAITDGDIAQ